MSWRSTQILEDFEIVARLAGAVLSKGTIEIEVLTAPHMPPTRLPSGKQAVYVFCRGSDVLKVGKVGPNSQARYTSQHYNAGSALSTLAASILADRLRLGLTQIDEAHPGKWIKENCDRVNFLMDQRVGVRVLTLFEAFLLCKLAPRYEGFKGQRG